MSSRKHSQNKPAWKRYTKQQKSYVREYAYDDEGLPVMEEGHYVTKELDGTLTYSKENQVYRDRPNRAFVRAYASKILKNK